MTTVEKPEYSVIGTRPVRPDGAEKVTGRAQYGADIRLPGMVHARVLRSPHAHARVLSINTQDAAAMPGVLAVVTNEDFPTPPDSIQDLGEGSVNVRELTENILASGKVLYRGHPVAAVAALSPHQALAALAAIKVEYEALAPVLDVREAMQPGAPLLNEERRTKSMTGELSEAPSNVASTMTFAAGDVEAAFAEADHVVDREFTTSMVHQGYIEPHNATAAWNADGTLTVWTSTQGAFTVRSQVATVLGLPVSSVRVVPMEIGGGFGGKIPIYLDPVAAILSKKCGRPVQALMDRTEVFEASGPTSGSWIRCKAASKDGKLTAVQAELAYEAGAFPGSAVGAGMMTMLAPYQVSNALLNGSDVVVNKPKTSAYRAPGAPAAAFAIEQCIDELAALSGTDPVVFRRQNASHEGSRNVMGAQFPRIGCEEVLDAAAASDHWNSPIEGPNRGRGFAQGFWFNAGMQSSVLASLNEDGSINLIEGSTDIGGTRASLSMQLAETLGIGYEAIKPTVVDTDSIGHNDVTGGSRTTYASGLAVYEAGKDMIEQLMARAAILWEADVADITWASGAATHKDGRTMSLVELAGKMGQSGGPLQGKGTVMGTQAGPAFAAHIVDVEVDPDTGKTEILRYTAIQDVGTAIHPSYVEGQIQGGAVQGIGWALNEEYYYGDDGRMHNSSFLDYRMPTALDLPMIDTILVEVPNPGHPYGVRGVGEVPIVPPLAAIANAVNDATGHRFTDLPISPRRVVEELNSLG